ncbi:MAG: acyl carrier protein [Deltaproteobacteria bacterium]|nr:acyl carrier protein [Deltaproteobacteria bacterium]
MDRFEQLREIMALTFDVPPESISAATTRDSLAKWDSLAHLNLMLAIEDGFGVTLTVDEMSEMTSVAAILARVGQG